MASAIERALAAQYAGNGPMFMPSTPVSDLYAGMYPTQHPRQSPLAPSQGGSWPNIPQRPRATALSPQNYSPTALPHDNSQRLASGQLPFINYPSQSPIDITVGTAGAPQMASVPMPQRRPWDAPTTMDLAAIAGQGQPQPPQMGYAPQPQTPAAVAAINGLSPLTASERINQPMPGQAAPYASPRDMTRAEMYDATNKAAAEAARTRDRSGVGSDGYVRNATGQVIGRDAKYQGMNPGQMYNAISGRPQDDSWKTIGPSGGDRHDEARRAAARARRAGINNGSTAPPMSLTGAMTSGSKTRR